MAKVFLKTYGCQMNERDSEQVARMLIDRGHALVSEEEEAEVILLNTCSVRDSAERKALGKMASLIRLRRSRPSLVLGYLGCVAQERGEELLRLSPHVDLVAGTQKFHRVAEMVDRLLDRRAAGPLVDVGAEDHAHGAIRDHLENGAAPAAEFVSIMQGCNMSCSFCIVPTTRGAERSRPQTEIVEEIRLMAARGVREVTLLGQIVNLYGRHEFPALEGRTPFVQLLEAVCAIEGIERVRFTSPHPRGFGNDLVSAYTRLPKLCEHVHLPVQSGSDRMLRLMRRAHTRERYLQLATDLRASLPDMALTTDLIVGFPGETEADYLQTRDLVERIRFDNAFVFRYSPRRATSALELPDPVPDEESVRRHADLLATVDRHGRERTANWLGRSVEILCEGPSKNNAQRFSGRTRQNKIVVFPGSQRHIGRLFDVRITETTSYTLYGEPDVLDPSGRVVSTQEITAR